MDRLIEYPESSWQLQAAIKRGSVRKVEDGDMGKIMGTLKHYDVGGSITLDSDGTITVTPLTNE